MSHQTEGCLDADFPPRRGLVSFAERHYGLTMSKPTTGRIVSVDFLRGLTVAFMIVANNPGDTQYIYRELLHTKWHGWSAVDFIFPVFLYLVGVSVALAVRRGPRVPAKGSLWSGAFRRAGTLFLLGLVVNGFPFFHLESLRIPGVLQRIAVVYLAVLWLHLRLDNKKVAAAIAAILVGYWLLWAFVPVPGLGYATLDWEYNLEGWLDQLLMRGHLWEYNTTWDPEGILSTVPCVAMGLMGVLAGRFLRTDQGDGWRAMLLAGISAHLAGLAWNVWFPINKVITTSSFVLFVGGFATMLLALAHKYMDRDAEMKPWRIPMMALGRNALFIYVLSQLLTTILFVVSAPMDLGGGKSLHFWLFDMFFGWMSDRYAASLGWAVLLLGGFTALAVAMYRKGVTIKL